MKIDPGIRAIELFTRPAGREPAPAGRAPASAGRDLVPVEAPSVPVPAAGTDTRAPDVEAPLGELIPDTDVRNMSPRQAADLGMDLYVAGVLPWEEYAMLAFQPELHPDFARTIGALTGQKAEPDRPRDFVAIWEDRLAFERQHNAADTRRIDRTERIVTVLLQIASPTNVVI